MNLERSERPGNRLACPRCLSSEFLGEFVIGWRELREAPRMVDGKVVVQSRGSVYDPEHMAFFCSNRGCNVDEEIPERRLARIDRDGNRVVQQPAEQGRLV
jgi:hypothetical protein